MRLWHHKLLPYLPDKQLRGQLRELVAIMHDWRDKGRTNHMLINRVMEYPRDDLYTYFLIYAGAYEQRFGKPVSDKLRKEFYDFAMVGRDAPPPLVYNPFFGWHDKQYLRICMANLVEKSTYAMGKNAISPADLARLYNGYKQITGEDYWL